MARALGLDLEQVEIGTIYSETLFEDQASGGRRRLTDYIIASYLIYLLQSQDMPLTGSALATQFVAQVQADLGITYTAQVMQSTTLNMTNGFMNPIATPKCLGASTCWNLQEGDGYCISDQDCQTRLKCGSRNCMDFADKATGGYYQEGGWADGGNCCYDELMFTTESSAASGIMMHIIIGGGVLLLCLLLLLVYVVRRSSRKGAKLVNQEIRNIVELEEWGTEEDDLPGDHCTAPGSSRVIVTSSPSSDLISEQEEGLGELKSDIGREGIPLIAPIKTTDGVQGERSEMPIGFGETADLDTPSVFLMEEQTNEPDNHSLSIFDDPYENENIPGPSTAGQLPCIQTPAVPVSGDEQVIMPKDFQDETKDNANTGKIQHVSLRDIESTPQKEVREVILEEGNMSMPRNNNIFNTGEND